MIDGWSLYSIDTETTGLSLDCDIIELSIIRESTKEQKTWCIKPTNIDVIEPGALRVNGHKIEDITWKTPYGRETYKEPDKVIVEIENWIMEDDLPAERRVLVAFNVVFDKPRLELLWARQEATDSFPFGRRVVDPMIIEFMLDLSKGKLEKAYSQKAVAKKYGKSYKGKAHTADVDTMLLSEILEAQTAAIHNILTKGSPDILKDNEDMKALLATLYKEDIPVLCREEIARFLNL